MTNRSAAITGPLMMGMAAFAIAFARQSGLPRELAQAGEVADSVDQTAACEHQFAFGWWVHGGVPRGTAR